MWGNIDSENHLVSAMCQGTAHSTWRQRDPLILTIIPSNPIRAGTDVGCISLAVEYRKAPEDPFPAAVDDAIEALRWLVQSSNLPVDAENIAVGGCSA